MIVTPIYAENSQELEDKLQQTQDKIKDLEDKLGQVKATANSLNSQIKYMDNQILTTELRITDLENEIDRLIDQVASLNSKISNLDGNLDQLATLLSTRIRQTYKSNSNNSILNIFLGSIGFNQLNSRVKYLQTAQVHDRKLMIAMEQTKSTFEQQKLLKEQKQQELDLAHSQLATEKVNLDQQKSNKQALLSATKSDEKRYQELLSAALAEQNAIQDAIASIVKQLKDGTPVDEGAQIALMGNSGAAGGCSTGAHLHFEVTDPDGNHQNPANYLKSDWQYTWDNSPDSPFSFNGSWNWPMSNPRITQGYGYTWWASTGFYGGKPHTGLDMVGQNGDTIIRTPRSGILYKGTASCGGKPMNYVAVEHEADSLITWYWHVQ